jgi:zinc transporter ZupT
VFFFHLLSMVLSMSSGPVIGMPLGLVFVIHNLAALFGVMRSSYKDGTKKIIRFLAIATSFLLLILSLWVPLYFYGKPLIRL